MSDDETGTEAPDSPDVDRIVKQLGAQLDPRSPWYPIIGKYTVGYIVLVIAILAVELTYGLPIVTVANSAVVGGIMVFLYGSVETWLASDQPSVLFYACPNHDCPRDSRFLRVAWERMPEYRKVRACTTCGVRLIRRCQAGTHFIVPEPGTQDGQSATPGTFCVFCTAERSNDERRYLPTADESVEWLHRSYRTPWRERYRIVTRGTDARG